MAGQFARPQCGVRRDTRLASATSAAGSPAGAVEWPAGHSLEFGLGAGPTNMHISTCRDGAVIQAFARQGDPGRRPSETHRLQPKLGLTDGSVQRAISTRWRHKPLTANMLRPSPARSPSVLQRAHQATGQRPAQGT